MIIGERAIQAITEKATAEGKGIISYAKEIGIEKHNLRNWVRKAEPRAYSLSLMAEAGLDVHWILTGQRVDKVEVVRCEDCKKRYTPDCIMSDGLGEAGDNDFCSYGERRGDNAGA